MRHGVVIYPLDGIEGDMETVILYGIGLATLGVAGLLDWQQMKREAKREAERQARARSRQRWGSATSACTGRELEAMKRR